MNKPIIDDGLSIPPDLFRESVVVVGLDGRITGWNRASETIYGWSRDQVEGQSFESILGSRKWPELEETSSPREHEQDAVEVRRSTATQEEVIISTRVVLRRDGSGAPLDWLEFGADLTAQRRAEWSEKASRIHFQNVSEAIPAAICAVDFSEARATLLSWLDTLDVDPRQWLIARPEKVRELMRATYVRGVNDFTVELFRVREASDMLTNVERFWPDSAIPDFVDWILSAIVGENTFQREILQRTHDGRDFPAWFTARFAPGTIDEGRFIVTVMDYTDIKRTQAAVRQGEAFYNDMFHGSAFSAWRLDATSARQIYARLREQGVTDFRAALAHDETLLPRIMEAIKVVDVNETTVQLFEARDRAEMVGSTITPYWIPDNLDALIGSLEATFNNTESYRSIGRMRTLKGNEIDVLYTRSSSGALRNAGELLLAIVDITDKVQAQNELAETQTRLAHAARVSSLGELTASIAHEVKQPLAAISLYGETVLRWLDRPEPDWAEVRDLARRMIADAGRASDIVSRVRAMATPQATPHRLLSLNTIVMDTLAFIRPELRKQGVSQRLDLDADLPLIFGDYIQLQQVLVNLTVNAMQAMEATPEPQISIRTGLVDHYVQLDFLDNGPGVSDEHVSRLFQSFFTTKKTGVGIGLGICRSIVESHGGTISLENSRTSGARFVVRLPLKAIASQ